jgi:EAL domain-containing protein (putative c-di-GMP-specific phosphodiesterase class I)
MEVNPQFENLRVMIVDDDAMTLRVMSHLLGALGVKDPLTAGDGQQALEYIDGSARPDVIFSDLNMPGLDGVEFFRHLSERGVAASIVLISGEDKRILETAKTLGAAHDLQVVGTLQKPIIIDDLDRLLSQCLEAGSKAASGAISPVTEAELMEGLKDPPDGAVQVVFQPKVEVATGAVLGVEALARWNHPTRGLLEPDSFIPLTETLGQATRLTEIVTRYVTAEAGRWGENGSQLQLAINTSVSALHRLDLPEFIVSSANEAGIDPSRITVELTESQLMQEFKKSMEILTRLRLKGVKLSIDDFGTGFSSMEQLRRIPFNELKIDKSFVTGSSGNPETRAMLEASVDLAKKLELVVVAEGVESREDLDLVASLGCDIAQGYYLARPMDAQTLLPWIHDWHAETLQAG